MKKQEEWIEDILELKGRSLSREVPESLLVKLRNIPDQYSVRISPAFQWAIAAGVAVLTLLNMGSLMRYSGIQKSETKNAFLQEYFQYEESI